MPDPAPSAVERSRVIVGDDEAGNRLDTVLAEALPGLSRARVQDLLKQGFVREVAGPHGCGVTAAEVPAGKRRVKQGEVFEVTLPEPEPALPRGQGMALDVLFEDEHLLVLDKPAGLVVHPAPGHADGTLVNALIAHCGESLSGVGGVRRPGVVHRLDKDVSGLMVVAKHDRAHLGLAGQFSVHSVDRAYEAVAYGRHAQATATVDEPIGRHPVERKRMAVRAGGKRAVTRFERLEASEGGLVRLRCVLFTGRTHQIRVHAQFLGLPLVGDALYRPRKRPRLGEDLASEINGLGRILLHARVLGFNHPVSGEPVRWERPPPEIFDRMMDLSRGTGVDSG